MGIRETLNKNPAIATGATAAIILFALIFILWELFGGNGAGDAPAPPTKAYFTVDDGATYFADDINKIAPFDHDGKPASEAEVYKCKDGKPFVAFLVRYSAAAQKKVAAIHAKAAAPNDPADAADIEDAKSSGREVKHIGTGDKGWLKISDRNASKVTDVRCPAGGDDVPEQIYP